MKVIWWTVWPFVAERLLPKRSWRRIIIILSSLIISYLSHPIHPEPSKVTIIFHRVIMLHGCWVLWTFIREFWDVYILHLWSTSLVSISWWQSIAQNMEMRFCFKDTFKIIMDVNHNTLCIKTHFVVHVRLSARMGILKIVISEHVINYLLTYLFVRITEAAQSWYKLCSVKFVMWLSIKTYTLH